VGDPYKYFPYKYDLSLDYFHVPDTVECLMLDRSFGKLVNIPPSVKYLTLNNECKHFIDNSFILNIVTHMVVDYWKHP